ncbi:putative short chain dehydrogenase/reductase [Xylona heveae TC161]|uniref:Putative short chain dehydrogenase/reductase n=1 Tax=Xylona heveae (strain CBS 132557 / TC161) TaxID=1328760 RepID=A0A165FZ64_XYLHT|nr:putative short chain dehydrogenase/reductase [Xylona heveae TC161]KZF21555.1 putative short chain dehydrogenase/reductase [Xylona heveae TC161]
MSGLFTYHNFSLSETPPLTGKVAVITGGHAGIGREITAQLLLHDIAKVYILGRKQENYSDAIKEWTTRKSIPEEECLKRTEFLTCDLSDLVAVKSTALDIVKKIRSDGGTARLDMLFANAGVPTVPEYTLSPQGIETIFAANHLGHFALINILLPLLETTASKYGNARIIVTTSSFHMGCQELDLALLTSPTRTKSPANVDSCWRYARSKLANILFTRQLAKLLSKKSAEKVYANCFFPGNIPTGAMDTWKDLFGSIGGGLLKGMFQVVGQSTADGAATGIFLAASPEVERAGLKGKYFIPIATEDQTSKLAENKDLAHNLWYWSDHQTTKALGKDWQDVAVEIE